MKGTIYRHKRMMTDNSHQICSADPTIHVIAVDDGMMIDAVKHALVTDKLMIIIVSLLVYHHEKE